MANDNELPQDDLYKNFGMSIPSGPTVIPEMVEDPRGAPIYQECEGAKSEWGCACTGRCKQVIGWSQDPEKVAAHREYIRQYNETRNKPNDFYKWKED